jgi:hypothetical protein
MTMRHQSAPTSLYRSMSGSQPRSPRGGDRMNDQVRNLLQPQTMACPLHHARRSRPLPLHHTRQRRPLPLEQARWRRPSLFRVTLSSSKSTSVREKDASPRRLLRRTFFKLQPPPGASISKLVAKMGSRSGRGAESISIQPQRSGRWCGNGRWGWLVVFFDLSQPRAASQTNAESNNNKE